MNCLTPKCGKMPGIAKAGYCYSCAEKRDKEKNPVRYAYRTLKKNAKRRGKQFSLSLEQFKKVVCKSGYMDKKGRELQALQIDRINVNAGYSMDNIQVITMAQNLQKRDEVDYGNMPLDQFFAKYAGVDLPF